MKKLIENPKTLFGAAIALALLAGPAAADTSYTFPNVIEGSATILGAGGEREEVEPRMPILVGDRLWVPYDSRLELVLADRSLLRVEGDSEIGFEAVAYSADTADRATVLELREGHLQLVVPDDALGDTLPQLITPDATIYVHTPGTYRVTVSRRGWTELVVRNGRAEIADEREASLVDTGESAVAEGGARGYLEVRRAGRYDDLERWGDDLTREAELAYVPHVDRSIRYAAAPLARHGGWVSIGHRWAWRPRVAVSWRPYGHGYWRPTPAGLTWVSHDPWGHVTHHYGLWDYVPGYGWVWYPGSTYRPAWVHWYWGADYVGWCPSGYYASYYGHYDRGPRFGIYGWAGGSWGHFDHWSFVASVHFGDRHQYRHVRPGREMARYRTALARGIITSDPGVTGKNAAEVYSRLRGEVERHERSGRRVPDVSDFVARKPLRDDLRRAVLEPKPLTTGKPAAVARKLPERQGPRATVSRGDISSRKPEAKPYRVDRPDERRDDGRPAVSARDERPDPRELRDRVSRDRSPRATPRAEEPSSRRPTVRVPSRDMSGHDMSGHKESPRISKPRTSTEPRVIERREVPRSSEKPRVIERKPVPRASEKPRAIERREVPRSSEKPRMIERKPVPRSSEKPRVIERREVPRSSEKPRMIERKPVPRSSEKPRVIERREAPRPATRVAPSSPSKPRSSARVSGSSERRRGAIDRSRESVSRHKASRHKGSRPSVSAKKPRKKDN